MKHLDLSKILRLLFHFLLFYFRYFPIKGANSYIGGMTIYDLKPITPAKRPKTFPDANLEE
jgi:hypothetical protein